MKRLGLIGLVLICLMIAVSMILPVSAASSYLRGDADGDGKVTILDATAIQRSLAALPVKSFNEKAADVDGDGLNITDATWIQRYLAEFDNIHHINETVTIPDPTTPQPTTPQPTRDPYELPVV
ncbi:MAG: dockerin type I repeat-containing protein [Ruminococcus sp.]|nr:dockerin type I repeat-containing protein [Ruminococcus sp.]